jgi:hypothetical protein
MKFKLDKDGLLVLPKKNLVAPENLRPGDLVADEIGVMFIVATERKTVTKKTLVQGALRAHPPKYIYDTTEVEIVKLWFYANDETYLQSTEKYTDERIYFMLASGQK